MPQAVDQTVQKKCRAADQIKIEHARHPARAEPRLGWCMVCCIICALTRSIVGPLRGFFRRPDCCPVRGPLPAHHSAGNDNKPLWHNNRLAQRLQGRSKTAPKPQRPKHIGRKPRGKPQPGLSARQRQQYQHGCPYSKQFPQLGPGLIGLPKHGQHWANAKTAYQQQYPPQPRIWPQQHRGKAAATHHRACQQHAGQRRHGPPVPGDKADHARHKKQRTTKQAQLPPIGQPCSAVWPEAAKFHGPQPCRRAYTASITQGAQRGSRQRGQVRPASGSRGLQALGRCREVEIFRFSHGASVRVRNGQSVAGCQPQSGRNRRVSIAKRAMWPACV